MMWVELTTVATISLPCTFALTVLPGAMSEGASIFTIEGEVDDI